MIENAPSAAGQSLVALDFELSPIREIAVIAGAEEQELMGRPGSPLRRRFLPARRRRARHGQEQAVALAGRMPLLADRPARDNRLTTYICENFVCQEPVVGVEGVITALGKLGPEPGPGR